MANCNTIYARITLTFMFQKFIQVGLYLRGRYNTGKGGGELLIFGMLNGLHIFGVYIRGDSCTGDALTGYYGIYIYIYIYI